MLVCKKKTQHFHLPGADRVCALRGLFTQYTQDTFSASVCTQWQPKHPQLLRYRKESKMKNV